MKRILTYSFLLVLSFNIWANEEVIHRGSISEIYNRYSVFHEFQVNFKSNKAWVQLSFSEVHAHFLDETKVKVPNLIYDPVSEQVKFHGTVCAKIERDFFKQRFIIPTNNCPFEMRYDEKSQSYELVLSY